MYFGDYVSLVELSSGCNFDLRFSCCYRRLAPLGLLVPPAAVAAALLAAAPWLLVGCSRQMYGY